MFLHKLTGLLVVGLLVHGLAAAQASNGGMPAGLVLVAEVKGSVTTASGGTKKPLQVDGLVRAATVCTGAGSSAVLVFSNGTAIHLGADTEVAVESFLQHPFSISESTRLTEAIEEPSRSITQLRLQRGELTAQLKKLRLAQGSSFRLSTPAGEIEVRGTSFRVAVARREKSRRPSISAWSPATFALPRRAETRRQPRTGRCTFRPARKSRSRRQMPVRRRPNLPDRRPCLRRPCS